MQTPNSGAMRLLKVGGYLLGGYERGHTLRKFPSAVCAFDNNSA